MRLNLTTAALAVLLASCVAAPDRPPVAAPAAPSRPAPAPQAAAPAPVPLGWQDRPVTPGDWNYQAEGAGSIAMFGPVGGASLLTIRCDRASRQIRVLRAGAAPGPMTIRTSYGAVSWPPSGAAGGQVVRAANDMVLDQIAYSRGHFAVEMQGIDMLILPAWAEVGRVIEDCRA